MGLTDSVTLSLFFLAVSDFCFIIMSTVIRSFVLIQQFPQISPNTINLKDLVLACFWYSMVFYDTSMLIRVYTAVARACCVAIPLTFKNVFTNKAAVVSVGVIFIAVLVSRVPMLVSQGFYGVVDRATNVTRFLFYTTPLRPTAQAINDILNRNIVTWGAICLVLVSLFVLKYKLVSAARFRYQLKSGQADVKGVPEYSSWQKSDLQKSSVIKRAVRFWAKTRKLSTDNDVRSFSTKMDVVLGKRDLQVVKVVLIVSVIFIVCTLPSSITAVAKRLEPEFSIGFRYKNVLILLTNVFDTSSYINCSVNVLVYYHFNSKFRNVARRLLGSVAKHP
ncbi:unnamed protein product [Lymnaea stagnalis]|uniref:G-protein coupled receptors family 1 profile domain-containing protein n=1 Tax=Lymnaea stagnalis TaxID=6523 RepID=A0AAV2HCV8_LYMST